MAQKPEGRPFPSETAAIPAAIWTISLRVYFLPSGSIMITWEPLTWGREVGFDAGLALGDEAPGEDGVGAALVEPPLAAGDVTGGADDLAAVSSSLQAVAPSDRIPRDAAASRVAFFMITVPLSLNPQFGG